MRNFVFGVLVMLTLVLLIDRFLLGPRFQVLPVLQSGTTSTETTVLRAQLEQQTKAHDQLVGMLGSQFEVVATIALGLAAFGWFTTHWVYEREQDALRKEIATRVDQARASVETSAKEVADKQRDALISVISKAVDQRFDELKDRIDEASRSAMWTDYRLYRGEAERAESKNSFDSALLMCIRSLDSLMQSSGAHSLLINSGFDDIQRLVNVKRVKPGGIAIGEMGALVERFSDDPEHLTTAKHVLEVVKAGPPAAV